MMHTGGRQKKNAKPRTFSRAAGMRDLCKRLGTIVSSGGPEKKKILPAAPRWHAPRSSRDIPQDPSALLLVATSQFAAMVVGLEMRAEAHEAKRFLSPLSDAIAKAKIAIRRKSGLKVTQQIQAEAYKLVRGAAKACRWELASALEWGEPYPAWPTVELGKELKRTASTVDTLLEAALPRSRSTTGSGSGGTSDTSAPSTAPSASSSRRAENRREKISAPRNAPVSPGAKFVKGRRPSARVDARLNNLSGSGAICR